MAKGGKDPKGVDDNPNKAKNETGKSAENPKSTNAVVVPHV